MNPCRLAKAMRLPSKRSLSSNAYRSSMTLLYKAIDVWIDFAHVDYRVDQHG
jgi:hypothetical protein